MILILKLGKILRSAMKYLNGITVVFLLLLFLHGNISSSEAAQAISLRAATELEANITKILGILILIALIGSQLNFNKMKK